MAKLQRKSAKVFAEQAQAAVGGIAQFGSLAAGDIQYSKDVDVIQALDAYKNGWSSAVVGNKSPAMEDRNALDYLLSYQQAYIMQHGIPEWLSTETYYENSYVVDSNGELRVSTIDNNTGHDPIEDEGGQYWGYAGSRGSGKQIGEVYYSQSNLATDNKGALPLFTGELISNANNLYPQFYAWVLSHTELCKTQAQYDTAISTYGECPYYVIDDTNKTIRLPKLTNYIKMANSTNGITQSKAGLPDHRHYLNLNTRTVQTGTNFVNAKQPVTNGDWSGWASDSNDIYGKSNTVTPAHTTLYPWVCAYNAAIPASTAQAAEFQDALSNKADIDFSNVTAVHIVQTYHSGTEWYRVWSDGWCEQGGSVSIPGSGGTDIVFLVPMADTNYGVYAGVVNGKSTAGGSRCDCYNRTATGMTIDWTDAGHTDGTWWEVKGYKQNS